jgi:hypothetical protein
LQETRLTLWEDRGICLADWDPAYGFEFPSFLDRLWTEFGAIQIGTGPPYFINKWIELRIDGEVQWRMGVPKKVLKQRKEEADERTRQVSQ